MFPMNKKKALLFSGLLGLGLFLAIIFFRPLEKLASVFQILLSPVLKTANLGQPAKISKEFLKPKSWLIRENQNLQFQLQELKAKYNNYDYLQQENQKLAELLKWRQNLPAGWQLVPGRVLGFSTGNWYSTMLLDLGRRERIEPAEAVINEEGVVGRVLEAGTSNSRVLLITDPTSSVAVEVLRNSLPAVVSGQLGAPLILKYVVNSADLKDGDELVTSSQSGYFPPGLKVGRVIKVVRKEKELFASVLVKPAVDFSKLNLVFVVVR
jgi:rod shape-determining protein MreC